MHAELLHPGVVQTANIAPGMILTIFMAVLQERLIALSNAGRFLDEIQIQPIQTHYQP